MIFEIDFNRQQNDKFLINELGAYYLKDSEYPGLFINIIDFEHLRELLLKVGNHFKDSYQAIITYDPRIIYLERNLDYDY